MDKCANVLNPQDFIKLNCVIAGVINHFTISRLSFKDRSQYDNIITEIIRNIPILSFRLVGSITYIYKNKYVPKSLTNDLSKLCDKKEQNTFLLKARVYLAGPNVSSTSSTFYKENMLFKSDETSKADMFEQEFQRKFFDLLTQINSKYGTTYTFSFKFSRIYVHNTERSVNFVTGQDGQLSCVTSEYSTENISLVSLPFGTNNKKRKFEHDNCDDCDDDLDFDE